MISIRSPFLNKNQIYFAKTRADAVIPTKEDENAGYDLFASFEEDFIIIPPYHNGLIPTGIAWACSEDYYMQIEERSSTGVKGIKRNAGVVDSGYRGEIKVAIFNANDVPLVVSNISEENLRKKRPDLDVILFYPVSKAIAQGVIHRVEKMLTREVSMEALLSIPSKRQDNGWGSSNKD